MESVPLKSTPESQIPRLPPRITARLDDVRLTSHVSGEMSGVEFEPSTCRADNPSAP